MVGNLPGGYFDKRDLLKDLLHETSTTSAFLDRLAGVVPGWEIRSIGNPNKAYTKNLGFAADYFSEILHKLRRVNYQYVINRFTLNGASTRDVQAINKIVSGMIKLVYPDGNLDDYVFEPQDTTYVYGLENAKNYIESNSNLRK